MTPEDVVAQAIRVADGDHTMAAGALGEAVMLASGHTVDGVRLDD